MNGNSKREKVEALVRRAVKVALHEIAFDQPRHAEALRELRQTIEVHASHNLTYDDYRFKELTDVMNWKKPPKGD